MIPFILPFVFLFFLFIHHPAAQISPAQDLEDAQPGRSIKTMEFDLEQTSYFIPPPNETKDVLKAHQRTMFAPKKQRWHLKGDFTEDQLINLRIDVLPSETRPWIHLPNPRPDDDRAAISYVLVEDDAIRSFDASGNERAKLPLSETGLGSLFNPVVSSTEYTDNTAYWSDWIRQKGGAIRSGGGNILLEWTENGTVIRLVLDDRFGQPVESEIIREDSKTTITYTYECMDGHYVLVMKRTSIKRNTVEPDLYLPEFVSLTRFTNFQFTY